MSDAPSRLYGSTGLGPSALEAWLLSVLPPHMRGLAKTTANDTASVSRILFEAGYYLACQERGLGSK